MKTMKKFLTMSLSLLMIAAMAGCGGNKGTTGSSGEDTGAQKTDGATGVILTDVLEELSTSEDQLELAGKYTSTTDIPDAQVDPELVGTWKMADGNTSYTYNEDGTAKAATEMMGESDSTFTCLSCGDYKLIAEDVEMMTDSSDDETPETIVVYNSYKIENDALYLVAVESSDEYSQQSITQILVFYKADDNGEITDSLAKNPVNIQSYYGEWTYGDDDEGKFTINEDGLTLDGGEALPVAYNENGKLVVGEADNSSEYSASFALEKLYDTSEEKKVTEENYYLSLTYTGEDEDDRPNLADIMADWHAEYGYDQFYFNVSAKTPVK